MKCKLSDICSFRKGKIETKELNEKNYISTENMIPNKQGVTNASSLPKVKTVNEFKKGDVLVSNIRPYFKKILIAEYDGGCSNDILVFKANKGINNYFLYYLISDDAFFEYATVTAKGTKMPRGDKSSIMSFEVPDFDMGKQLKIASILKSIDDKIKINNKINNNLLEQADSIFKSWFIDFEPFNNEFPNDWNNGTIEDLSDEVVCGKTPSTKRKEYYGNDIPFITIPDMHNSTYIIKTERYLSVLGADSQPKKTLPKNSICVSCIGTAGLVSLVSIDSQTNQQINSIIPKKNISPYYIYLLMRGKYDEINKYGQGGSTIVNLNKREFSKLEVTIPSNDVLLKFDKIVKPMFEVILNNQNENEKLSNLRDYLLPNLINGIIDVSQIDI